MGSFVMASLAYFFHDIEPHASLAHSPPAAAIYFCKDIKQAYFIVVILISFIRQSDSTSRFHFSDAEML